MRIMPIINVFANNTSKNIKNTPEQPNNENPTFKTAAYRRAMAEAMEEGCVSHEKEVISLFDRLLKAAVNMKDVVKVGESPIFYTRDSLMERLSALYHNTASKVLLKRQGKNILEINNNIVRFTGLDDNPSQNHCEDVSFWVEDAKYGMETSYDKYLFHYNGHLKKHIHYTSDYSSSTVEHFDEDGEPRNFRNFLEDVFGI